MKQSQQDTAQDIQHKDLVPPPSVPAGYMVLDRPRPLDDDDSLWAALVWSEHDNIGGLLLYGYDDAPRFTPANEALTLLHYQIEWSAELVRHATSTYLVRHQHFAQWQTTSQAWQQWSHSTWQAICAQTNGARKPPACEEEVSLHE